MIELKQYQVLTFDCYGTLIDWESGVLSALRPILATHNIHLDDEQILEQFAEYESEQEQGAYIKYREVLKGVVQRLGQQFDFTPAPAELNSLADSIQHWQPFPDTVEALRSLKQKFELVIISNVDDDLFAATAKHLAVRFDQIITAEQVKSYKPSLNNFKVAFDRIGRSIDQILHVAASQYHDIVPANSLGLSTIWVNRRAGKAGAGATQPAAGQPDLEIPDLKTLADLSANLDRQ